MRSRRISSDRAEESNPKFINTKKMNDLEKARVVALLASDIKNRSQRDVNDMEELLSLVFEDSSSSSSMSSCSTPDLSFEQKQHITRMGFVEAIDSYSLKKFKSIMRLEKPTAEFLISLFSKSVFIPASSHGRRSRIGCRKTIFMYIWYISNTVTFKQLANLFEVSKSSAWNGVRRVSSWLISIGQAYVKWPQGVAIAETQKMFEEKANIPGVIGVIDSTHIYIRAPKIKKKNYLNKKQTYSIVLQTVVDAQNKFIDITCGEPGSLHATRVLQRSDLYTNVQTQHADLFPNGSFILGDSAYPSTSWLVPPFEDDDDLTDLQRHFNNLHSATRTTAENAFGLLTGRFQRLAQFTEPTNLMTITSIVVSACILHNICITKGDFYTGTVSEQLEQPDENYSEDIDEDILFGRREILFKDMRDKNIL